MFEGAIAPTGSLIAGRFYNLILTGAIAPIGTLRKQVNLIFAGFITPIGSIARILTTARYVTSVVMNHIRTQLHIGREYKTKYQQQDQNYTPRREDDLL
jgi:putative transposon-encoded protein